MFPPPKVLSARFVGGAAKISAGSLDVPIQASFGLIGGYPVFVQDKLEIDAGGAVTFTPLPYENTMTSEKKNASFTTLLADVGATYLVAPRIGLRGDLGVGVLLFGGISDAGNPFTDMGAPTSGALTMLGGARRGVGGLRDHVERLRDGRAVRVHVQPAEVRPQERHQVDHPDGFHGRCRLPDVSDEEMSLLRRGDPGRGDQVPVLRLDARQGGRRRQARR